MDFQFFLEIGYIFSNQFPTVGINIQMDFQFLRTSVWKKFQFIEDTVQDIFLRNLDYIKFPALNTKILMNFYFGKSVF